MQNYPGGKGLSIPNTMIERSAVAQLAERLTADRSSLAVWRITVLCP